MVGTNLASSGGGARRRPRGPSPRDWYHLPSYPNTLPGGGGSSLGRGSRGCGRGRAQPGLGSRELTRAWPLPAPPSHPASILAVPGAQLGSPSQRVIVSGLASWGAGLWDRGAGMRSGAGGCGSLLGSRHPAGGDGCRGTCVVGMGVHRRPASMVAPPVGTTALPNTCQPAECQAQPTGAWVFQREGREAARGVGGSWEGTVGEQRWSAGPRRLSGNFSGRLGHIPCTLLPACIGWVGRA